MVPNDELETLDVDNCNADELIAEIERQQIAETHLHTLAIIEQNQLLDDIVSRLDRVDVRQDEHAIMLTEIRAIVAEIKGQRENHKI